jgi:hypothetical protein
MQNDQGTKLIQDNIVCDNADKNLQIYGSTGSLVGFTVDNNTIYDNESWPSAHYQYNIVFGAAGTVSGNSFTNNHTFFYPQFSNDGSVSIGQFDR